MKKQKVIILAIHYDEKDKEKLDVILDEMKEVTAKINNAAKIIPNSIKRYK